MSVRSDLEAIYGQLAQVIAGLPPDEASNVVTVKAGDDLQLAIDSAPQGAEIRVAPGTYNGITLRAKSGGANLTVRPDTSALPADGQRISPAAAESLVKLQPTAGGLPTNIVSEPGATGYTLIGLQCLPGRADAAMVVLGSDTATDPAQQPDAIVLDRCLLVADSAKGGVRGIAANTRSLTVTNSYIAGFWSQADAQAICGWNGPGPFLIENCYLEASGENVMFGGGTSMSAAMMPSNLTMRGCYLTKPLAWQGMAGVTVKDVFELKAMSGAVIENNVFEYSWVDGQVGFVVQLTPRGQSGKSPWNTVENVVMRYNVMRHAAAGVNLLGTDNLGASGRMTNVQITDNLIYAIDAKQWGGTGRLMQVVDGPTNVECARNTVVGSGLNSFLSFSGAPTSGLNVHENVLTEGSYGLIGSGQAVGTPSWAAYTTNSQFTKNLIAKGTSGRNIAYPGTGNVVSAAGEAVVDPGTLMLTPTYAALAVGCDVAEVLKRTGAAI